MLDIQPSHTKINAFYYKPSILKKLNAVSFHTVYTWRKFIYKKKIKKTKKQADLLTPLGEDIEPKHPLLSLDNVFENPNLLLGLGNVGTFRLLHQFLQRSIRILRGPRHQRREIHRLLPQFRHYQDFFLSWNYFNSLNVQF